MALEFDTRRTTRDIDAVLDPPTSVAQEAASMAKELDLPPGWLSGAASALIPLPDEDPVSLEIDGLEVEDQESWSTGPGARLQGSLTALGEVRTTGRARLGHLPW